MEVDTDNTTAFGVDVGPYLVLFQGAKSVAKSNKSRVFYIVTKIVKLLPDGTSSASSATGDCQDLYDPLGKWLALTCIVYDSATTQPTLRLDAFPHYMLKGLSP